jgi:hypothetical protein
MLTSLIVLAALSQSPPHAPVRSRRRHDAAPTARDFGALLDADILLLGRIEDLERRVRDAERHRCRCAHEAPTPKPPPAPAGPAYEWRSIGGIDYYGVQDGPVFRYTHYRVPAAAPGHPAGACRR